MIQQLESNKLVSVYYGNFAIKTKYRDSICDFIHKIVTETLSMARVLLVGGRGSNPAGGIDFMLMF